MINQLNNLFMSRIKSLKNLKANNSQDRDGVASCEESMKTILSTLNLLIMDVKETNDLSIPDLSQMFDVTFSADIQGILTELALSILSKWSLDESSLVVFSRLLTMLTPYLKLLRKFNLDGKRLAKHLAENRSISKKELSLLIKTFSGVFEYEEVICEAIDNEAFIVQRSQAIPEDTLYLQIVEKLKLNKQEDENIYYSLLGEVKLACSLLDDSRDEDFYIELLLIYSFQGVFLNRLREYANTNSSSILQSRQLLSVYMSYKYKGLPSVAEDLVSRSKTLSEDLGEDLKRYLNLMTGYLKVIIHNIKIAKECDQECYKSLLESLFKLDTGSEQLNSAPPILQAWMSIHKIYSKYFPLHKMQTVDMISNNDLKNEIEELISSFIKLLCYGIDYLLESNLAVEVVSTCRLIFDDIIHLIFYFDLDECFPATSLINAFKSDILPIIFDEIWDRADLYIMILEKLKTVLGWSYTSEFVEIFERSQDPEALRESVSAFVTIVNYVKSDIKLHSQVETMITASPFNSNTWDLILSDSSPISINKWIHKAREGIIRGCIFGNLQLLSLLMNCADAAHSVQLPFINRNIQKVWKIIVSTLDCSENIGYELTLTTSVLRKVAKNHGIGYIRISNLNIIKAVCKADYFNLEVEPSDNKNNELTEILTHLSTHNALDYQKIEDYLAELLADNFKTILTKSMELENFNEKAEIPPMKKYLEAKMLINLFLRQLRCVSIDCQLNNYRSPVREAICKYLPKLYFSSIFHTVSPQSIQETMKTIDRHFGDNALIGMLISKYTQAYPEFLAAVSQSLQEPHTSATVEKKIQNIFNCSRGNVIFDHFDDECWEAYKINTKLKLITMFEMIDLKDHLSADQNKSSFVSFFNELKRSIAEITTHSIEIFNHFIKRNIQKSEPILRSGPLNSQYKQFCSQGCPFEVTEFFKASCDELMKRCARQELTKDCETSWLTRFSSLILLKQALSDLQLSHALKIIGSRRGFIAVIELAFEIFSDFSRVVLQHFDTPSQPLSIATIRIKQGSSLITSVDDLKRLYSLLRQEISALLKNILAFLYRFESNKQVTENSFGIVRRLVSELKPELLVLRLLDEAGYEKEASSLHGFLNTLLDCMSGILKTDNMSPFDASLLSLQRREDVGELHVEFLPKIIIFQDIKLSKIVINSYSKKTFLNLVQEHISSSQHLYTARKQGTQSSLGGVEVYQNSLLNRLRSLAWLSYIMISYVAPLNHSPVDIEIGSTLFKELRRFFNILTITDLKIMNLNFIRNDFVLTMRNLIIPTAQMCIGLQESEFNNKQRKLDKEFIFNILNPALEKWSELYDLCGDIDYHLTQITQSSRFVSIFYFRLIKDGEMLKFAENVNLLRALARCSNQAFYSILELYAVCAFESDEILRLKLQSLVYLNRTGSRLFESSAIRFYEQVCSSTLTEIASTNFVVKNCPETSRNVLELNNNGGMISIDHLQQAVSAPTRKLLEIFIDCIVSNTISDINHFYNEMAKDSGKTADYSIQYARVQKMHCLTLLLRNHTELLPWILSLKLSRHLHFSEHALKFILPLCSEETFLSFFLKYICSFYGLSVTHFLSILVQKSDNPIIVKVDDQLLPLSAYNEAVIADKIVMILESILAVPEEFLDTPSTTITWCLLSHIAASILQLPYEEKLTQFKLEIVDMLRLIHLRAAELVAKKPQLIPKNVLIQTSIITTALEELANIHVRIKAQSLLSKYKRPLKATLTTKQDLHWAYLILRNDQHALMAQEKSISLSDLRKRVEEKLENRSQQYIINKYSWAMCRKIIEENLDRAENTAIKEDARRLIFHTLNCDLPAAHAAYKFNSIILSLYAESRVYKPILHQLFNKQKALCEKPFNCAFLQDQRPSSAAQVSALETQSPFERILKCDSHQIFYGVLAKMLQLTQSAREVKLQRKQNTSAQIVIKTQALNNMQHENPLQHEQQQQQHQQSVHNEDEPIDILLQKIQRERGRIKRALMRHQEDQSINKINALSHGHISLQDTQISIEDKERNLAFFKKKNQADQKLVALLADDHFLRSLELENLEYYQKLRGKMFAAEKEQRTSARFEDQWVEEDFIVYSAEEDIGEEWRNDENEDPIVDQDERIEEEKHEGSREEEEKEREEEFSNHGEVLNSEEDSDPFAISPATSSEIEEDEHESREGDDEGNDNDNDNEDDVDCNRSDNHLNEAARDISNQIDDNGANREDRREQISKEDSHNNDNDDDVDDILAFFGSEEEYSEFEINPKAVNQADESLKLPKSTTAYTTLWSFNLSESKVDAEVRAIKDFEQSLTEIQAIIFEDNITLSLSAFNFSAANTQTVSENYIKYILYLFSIDAKPDTSLMNLNGVSQTSVDKSMCTLLLLDLLDPIREAVVLPVFALHIMGYRLKFLSEHTKFEPVTKKIITFLYQYATKHPDTFFKKHSLSSFLECLVLNENITKPESVRFSLIEALFELFITVHECANPIKDSEEFIILQKILTILIKFKSSQKIKEDASHLKDSETGEELFSVSEKSITTFIILLKGYQTGGHLTKVQNNHRLRLLEELSNIAEFRPQVLDAFAEMSEIQVKEEVKVLDLIVQRLKQEVKPASLERKVQKKIVDDLEKMEYKLPKLLEIVLSVIKMHEKDSNVRELYVKSQDYQNQLDSSSIHYLEAFERLDQAFSKNKPQNRDLKRKMRSILNYLFTSLLESYRTLNDLKMFRAQKNETILLNASPANEPAQHVSEEKTNTMLDNPQSMLKEESSGILNNLPQWIRRHQDKVNKMFKIHQHQEDEEDLLNLILDVFPWVLSFDMRENLMRAAIRGNNQEYEDEEAEEGDFTIVAVRRDYILHDTIKEFENKQGAEIVKAFGVMFINEVGVDQGGLKKEWLTLLAKELFNPEFGLFKLSSNARTIHPDPLSIIQPLAKTYFKLAGIVAGLAVRQNIAIEVNFSRSLLKSLIDKPLDLNDLEDIEPELTNSLRWMQSNNVTSLQHPFTYELDVFGVRVQQELDPNGSNLIITEENKTTFITKMCFAKMIKEVEGQINCFKEGFFEVLPKERMLKLFSASEVETMISGRSEIKVEDLKKYTKYQGLSADTPQVKWFWEILEAMDQARLASVLFFITATSKVPRNGFQNSPIYLTARTYDNVSLPIAHTCNNRMELPLYQSKEILYDKLLMAINEGMKGFHLA